MYSVASSFHMTVLDGTEDLLHSHWWIVTGATNTASELGTSQHPDQQACTAVPCSCISSILQSSLSSCSSLAQVLLAPWTIPQYCSAGGKDDIHFPPWHRHSCSIMSCLALRSILLHILTYTFWQLPMFDAHVLQVLHLNTPISWKDMFYKIFSVTRVWRDLHGRHWKWSKSCTTVHTKAPCICFRSYSPITSSMQTS